MRLLLVVSLWLAPAALAQHPFAVGSRAYDPRVPAPRAVIGHEVGERFTPHHAVVRYFERVAATSPRVHLDTLGLTVEGREYLTAVVTSERNHARRDAIRADAAQLADPRRVDDATLEAILGRMPTIVLLTYTVHGNEASGTEAALATLYELAASTDPAVVRLLDSVVVLIDPIQNPDGHERHVQDVLRRRSVFGADATPNAFATQSAWPGARTSHYHFDLNRDWFIQSHPETRARVGYFFQWWPHVVADLHEMGSNATYFFAPPMEPINKNVPPSVLRWWEIFASANGAALDALGRPYFRREGYDEFYPGYGVSWPILSGAIGMTYEQASSGAGAIQRNDGTILTLREAAENHYLTSMATVRTAALARRARLQDYLADRRSASRPEVGPRAIYLAVEPGGRTDSLIALLERNRVEVQPARTLPADATAYPHTRGRHEGMLYVVDLAQPQGRLARALLEPDAQLDSSFIREELERRRTAQSSRFYDITAWSLPMTHGVRAWTSAGAPVVREQRVLAGGVRQGGGIVGTVPAAHGYAFHPGNEAALRLLAALLRDSVRVHFATRPFTAGGMAFDQGAFVVRVAANGVRVHELVQQAATAAGVPAYALRSALVESGTDLGSNSVIPLPVPRVALLAGAPVNGNSYGFAWYTFEQRLGLPVTSVDAAFIAGGGLRDFTVLVMPSAGALGPALGEAGLQRLQHWVRDGGTLITLEQASAWLASEASGLSRLRVRRPAAGAPSVSANVPGALLRAHGDSLSPLLAGIPPRDLAVLVSGDRAFEAPTDARGQEVVVRLAGKDALRLSGYLWPESWDRHAEGVWLWSERQGRGRVTAFATDPNYRDLTRALMPIFAHAVFFGAY